MGQGPKAVVIGLASVTGLQTARIMAARGIDVIGIAGDPRHFAARTRVCERIIAADVHGEEFVEHLLTLGPELAAPAVLVPCTDQSVLAVSQHRDVLAPWFVSVLPPDDVVRLLMQKATFSAHAADHGLPVPATYTVTSVTEAESAAAELAYPALLKPSVKSKEWKRHAKVKAQEVSTAAELVSAYRRLSPWADAMVAQEYVPGGDELLSTSNCYFDRSGELRVVFTTRKRRQWPPHVGTASFAEETHDPELVDLSRKLFEGVGFRGLGYLEVKRHADTKQTFLMEANVGRPTGRSATADASGVELLYTLYCDALGLPMPAEVAQRHEGATWLDLRRDLLAGMHYWRRGELTPREWLRSVRAPTAHAVMSRRDPLPFAFELGQSGRKAARRFVRRMTERADPTHEDA